MSSSSPRIAEIVLTGGSCAGKTVSLGSLASLLRHAGHPVITIPEVATMLITGGVGDIGEIAREDGAAYCAFQREVFLTHRALRRRAAAMAQSHRTPLVVILYDRGELDGMAYHQHDCFDGLAAEDGTTIDGIRNSYSAVMHLVTAADGAEECYSKETNSARWDNLEEARRFDKRIVSAWQGNPRHRIIDNRTDYQGKLERLFQATLTVLDAPGQLQLNLTREPEPLRGDELELRLESQPLSLAAPLAPIFSRVAS